MSSSCQDFSPNGNNSANCSAGKQPVCINNTDTFGHIKFLPINPGYQKTAKYVRLADDTEPGKVIEFMKDKRQLLSGQPDLVISVIGGGKKFQLEDTRKKDIFNHGLIEAIRATHGWIITFGFNYGIGAAVGAAVHEGPVIRVQDDSEWISYIQCLGITPWLCVKNRDELKNPELSKPYEVTYEFDEKDSREELNSLEPNHSHFLLIDDGHGNGESGTAQFRTKLEKKISQSKEKGGENIPVVCVLVEGGIFSVQSVCDSLSHDLPVIICKGTGRAADLLANFYTEICLISDDDIISRKPSLKTKVKDSLSTMSGSNTKKIEDEADLAALVVDTFMDKRNLIEMFDMTKDDNLDASILSCLINSRQKEISAQLRLAQKWNRADIARNSILNSRRPFTDQSQFYGLFRENLVENRVEFVRLFIDKGFDVSKYLNETRLHELYNFTIGSSACKWRKIKAESFTLADIDRLLQNIRYQQEIYKKDTGQNNDASLENPFLELFIWAVIIGRYEMTLYLWEKCHQPLLVAIIGTLICHKLRKFVSQSVLSDSPIHQQIKSELECRAVGLIDQASKKNLQKSLELIEAAHPLWGGRTIIDLAALSHDQNFLACHTCQTYIQSAWKKGFQASGKRVISFTLFPPLWLFSSIIFLPRKTRTKTKNVESATKMQEISNDCTEKDQLTSNPQEPIQRQNSKAKIPIWDQNEDLWYRIKTFYTSPVVKFTSHTISYVLFLSLYIYVALFSFRPTKTAAEMWLQLWIVTLTVDELRAGLQYKGKHLKDKFREWWSFSSFSNWNIVALIATISAVIAFGLSCWLETFMIGRAIFCLNFIPFLFRSFKFFFVSSRLGPKVIMIKRMIKELVTFLLVVFIFLLAYSVTSQSLMEPHRDFYWLTFYDILNHAIWELFGELQDEPTSRDNFVKCLQNDTNALPFECGTRWWPIPLLLAAYFFAGNVLMMNLLIATFTHVFEEVQSNSEQIWKHQMYFLVEEYKSKPFLPPPFIIFCHGWILIRSKICSAKRPEIPKESEFLAVFERVSRADYLQNRRIADANLPENLIASMAQKISELTNLAQTFSTSETMVAKTEARQNRNSDKSLTL